MAAQRGCAGLLAAAAVLVTAAHATQTAMFVRFLGVDGTEDPWRVEGMNLFSDSGCSVKLPVKTATTFYTTKLLANGEEEYQCDCHGGELSQCPCGDAQKDLGTCNSPASGACVDTGSCAAGRCAVVLGLPPSTTLRCVQFYQNTLGSGRRLMDTIRVEYSTNCDGQQGGWVSLKQQSMEYQDFRTPTNIELADLPPTCSAPELGTTTTEVATVTTGVTGEPPAPDPECPATSTGTCEHPFSSYSSEAGEVCEGQVCASLLNGFDPSRPNTPFRSPLEPPRVCVQPINYDGNCACESKAVRITSSEQYASEVSADVEIPGIGSFGGGAKREWSREEGRETFVSKCICNRLQFTLDPQLLASSARFLEQVGAAADLSDMEKVVNLYGTHFVNKVEKGGMLIVETTAKSCSHRSAEDNRLGASFVSQYINAGLEVSSSQVWGQDANEERISITALGGDPTLDFSAWAASLETKMNVISSQVTEARCRVPVEKRPLWDLAVKARLQTTTVAPTTTAETTPATMEDCVVDSGSVVSALAPRTAVALAVMVGLTWNQS